MRIFGGGLAMATFMAIPLAGYVAGNFGSDKVAVAADDLAARYAFCRQALEQ
jgi:hypothetical protein